MIKLYGRGQSRSFRGVWALQECGLEFEYKHVDPANLEDGYADLNSQARCSFPMLLATMSGAAPSGIRNGKHEVPILAGRIRIVEPLGEPRLP